MVHGAYLWTWNAKLRSAVFAVRRRVPTIGNVAWASTGIHCVVRWHTDHGVHLVSRLPADNIARNTRLDSWRLLKLFKHSLTTQLRPQTVLGAFVVGPGLGSAQWRRSGRCFERVLTGTRRRRLKYRTDHMWWRHEFLHFVITAENIGHQSRRRVIASFHLTTWHAQLTRSHHISATTVHNNQHTASSHSINTACCLRPLSASLVFVVFISQCWGHKVDLFCRPCSEDYDGYIYLSKWQTYSTVMFRDQLTRVRCHDRAFRLAATTRLAEGMVRRPPCAAGYAKDIVYVETPARGSRPSTCRCRRRTWAKCGSIAISWFVDVYGVAEYAIVT